MKSTFYFILVCGIGGYVADGFLQTGAPSGFVPVWHQSQPSQNSVPVRDQSETSQNWFNQPKCTQKIADTIADMIADTGTIKDTIAITATIPTVNIPTANLIYSRGRPHYDHAYDQRFYDLLADFHAAGVGNHNRIWLH